MDTSPTNTLSASDAIQTLQSMGLRVQEQDGSYALRVDGHSLDLGAEPDWTAALVRAGRWLDQLGEAAAEDGEALVRRREALGFADCEAFCRFSGIDAVLVEEAEGGLIPALPVHRRVLEWLESGRLRRD